jgi:hypothetical protein
MLKRAAPSRAPGKLARPPRSQGGGAAAICDIA